MSKSLRDIDLNKILKVSNLGILVLLWYSYYKNGESLYVNLNTILLGTVLSLQIGIFLFLVTATKSATRFNCLLLIKVVLENNQLVFFDLGLRIKNLGFRIIPTNVNNVFFHPKSFVLFINHKLLSTLGKAEREANLKNFQYLVNLKNC